MTPVAMLDWSTNERMPGASSPSGRGAACGNRLSAESPTTDTTPVETHCARTMAASASVTPYCAPTAIAIRRSAPDPAWYAPRRS